MPYLNVDDDMPWHPDVWGLSDAAFRLYVSAMCYSAKYGTDGIVPHSRLRTLSPSADDVVMTEVMRSGRFHDLGHGCPKPASVDARECHAEGSPGHFLVHNFLRWNHSHAWWQKRKADQRERKRKYDEKRRTERDG
jgi:hypothetical protein